VDLVDQVVCHHGVQDLDQWEDLRENGALQEALEGQDLGVQDLEVLVHQVGQEEMEAGVAVKRSQRLLRRRKLMRLI
jgi:hypothetical protein